MLSSSQSQSESHSKSQSQPSYLSFTVENDSLRLVGFLKWKLGISSGHVGRLLERDWITVNSVVRSHKSALLTAGDVVTTHATSFQMRQVRFALPLLTVRYQDSLHAILWKPAGMPLEGKVSETVATALPASMPNSSYHVVDCVGRIASGPILVRFHLHECDEVDVDDLDGDHRTATTSPTPTTKAMQKHVLGSRFTFMVIVHGMPPPSCHLDVDGFESLDLVQSISTTMTPTSTSGTLLPSSVLSMIQIVLDHSGVGLRGCLLRHGYPILGTSARSKSKTNGCFLACTKVELMFSNQTKQAVIVESEVPSKFRNIVQREERFYRVRQLRLEQQEQQNQELRSQFLQEQGHHLDLTTEKWDVAVFCGQSYYVTDHVMTPRASSELLVRVAKQYLSDHTMTHRNENDSSVSILDLGTGSGCLIISTLLGESDNIVGVGVDVSVRALGVAKINTEMHGLFNRVVLRQGDFEDLTFLGETRFDIILCNPPYLTQAECDKDGLLGPRLALVSPDNMGMGCYQSLANQVHAFLKPKNTGILILEVGGKRKVSEVLAMFQNWDCIETHLDVQGQARCLVLRHRDITPTAEGALGIY
ncbi:hypothetical protein MHU86_22031 [Fragilaria crotonensis]|nr:hypothetical protein MHU86_22031 [Fragilaria crotonensis]